jgi:hypothetical protein
VSKVVGFNERLKRISNHGIHLKWVIESEAKGHTPTASQLIDHIKATDIESNPVFILKQLIESEAIIQDSNLIRINGPVTDFILWASDASNIMPGSRIEQIFSEVITQINSIFEKLNQDGETLRQKGAYITERVRDINSKLLTLRGAAAENVRTVINSSSSLRLLKEDDRLKFIARVSKLWEEDIDPISGFRKVTSDLQIRRREARSILESMIYSGKSSHTIRRDSERILELLDMTWDRIAYSHDIMIKEVRPLYKLAQRMKSTISIVNAAENMINHIITQNKFTPNLDLSIPSLRVNQLFSDLSIDSFILTLGDVEDEAEYVIPPRASMEEIDTINPPIDIMELVKNEKFIPDAMEFVLSHPLTQGHTIQECAIAVYSRRGEIEHHFNRDSNKKLYSKENSDFDLLSRPIQIEVIV